MLKSLRKRINIILTGTVGTTNSIFRENWLESVLNDIPKGMKILDAGAGESQYKKYCTHLDYVSQDFAEYDGTGDSKGNSEGITRLF